MLRIGLTGGIAAGKSVVARRMEVLGAVLVDSDVLARNVVEPGSEGLREVVAAFGPGILTPDESLDRGALGRLIFGDPTARERLNSIVHPRVRAAAAELVSTSAEDSIVVEDIPLLVETGQAPRFHVVVVVDAADELRVQRMVEHRGMDRRDAEQRIAAQAGREERLEQADAILVNDRSPAELLAATDALWHERLLPFAANLAAGRPATGPAKSGPTGGSALAGTVGLAGRVQAKVAAALAGGAPVQVEQLDDRAQYDDVAAAALRLTVSNDSDLGAVSDAVGAAGFPRVSGTAAVPPDHPVGGTAGASAGGAPREGWTIHRGADPATTVTLYLGPAAREG